MSSGTSVTATPWNIALQFLTGLQYTDANTQHFAEWYGGWSAAFYVSHRMATFRIEHTPSALMALSLYLEYVVR